MGQPNASPLDMPLSRIDQDWSRSLMGQGYRATEVYRSLRFAASILLLTIVALAVSAVLSHQAAAMAKCSKRSA